MKKQDLTNRIFGKLIAVGPGQHKGKQATWHCKCECGNELDVMTSMLLAGDKKSCGCTIIRHNDDLGNAKHLYRRMGVKAKNRNLEFSISFNEFLHITKQNCDYCGDEPMQSFSNNGTKHPYIYNGMDRVDNKMGYKIDNIVPCCGTCNIMKGRLDKEKFIIQAKKINNHVI